MKKSLLATVAAVALIAGTGLASAEGAAKEQPGMNAGPAMKAEPEMKKGADIKSGAEMKAEPKAAVDNKADPKAKPTTTGQAAEHQGRCRRPSRRPPVRLRSRRLRAQVGSGGEVDRGRQGAGSEVEHQREGGSGCRLVGAGHPGARSRLDARPRRAAPGWRGRST